MDFNHVKVRQVVEEDRLSSLPDELIHKILSSFNIRFVIRMCLLSSRWRRLWRSMPYLNFSRDYLQTLRKFSRFVTLVLYCRNHQAEVSLVKLLYRGAVNQDFVKKIANYAFSHNVRELIVGNCPRIKLADKPPPFILSSQSLKHFTFMTHCYSASITLTTPLNFPALTTLSLRGMVLTGDLFSKCVNLRKMTLENFVVDAVEVFDIITPRLSNLILTDSSCSRVINLIAPQLENLTIDNCSIKCLNAPPGLSSLCYQGRHHLPLSMDRLRSLKEITLSQFPPCKEEDACKIINMLQELHNARYLTLNAHMVECLSSFPDLLSRHSSPFSYLICLTIDSRLKNDEYKVKMSTEARNFFFENSPSATLITKLPKGCQRLCQHEDVS